VTMRVSVHPGYDRSALSAARSWQYFPALLRGVPVKYRKMVQIRREQAVSAFNACGRGFS